MRAFQTAFKPSRSLKTAVLALHSAAAAVCGVWFHGIMMWCGFFGLAAACAYAWRTANLKGRHAVRRVAVNRLQQAAVSVGQDETVSDAVLGGASLVTQHVMFLQWDSGSRRIWQLVLPDMLDAENHRRLRVWARWCQEENRPSEKRGPL